ncbi:MAG: coproporphyrinogen III oxidase family protein [Alphaproteobacteria bacterium]|nr:coproporphyrinogen III oxidase family protein [Alphaproteobacteria bacterium]
MINARSDVDYWESTRKGFVTNYPNFLHWAPMQPAPLRGAGPLNVYLHTPYCIQRCSYCYYKTVNLQGHERKERMGRYVDALCRDIAQGVEAHGLAERQVDSVYMGGGTPTLLEVEHLEQIFAALREHLNIDGAEITVEAEPVTLNKRKAAALRELGVNRVSMGVQSFNDEIVKSSNRLDGERHALRAIETAQSIGASLNIDLMSGLAGETSESWAHSVEQALACGVESITVYKTELYANTQYYRDQRRGRISLPSDTDEMRYMRHAMDRFDEAGLVPWSFYTFTRGAEHAHVHAASNFRGNDCVSFGVSAFGHIGGTLFQNTNDEQRYIDEVNAGRLPMQRGHTLSLLDAMIRYTLLNMKLMRVDLGEFHARFGLRLERLCAQTLESLVEAGLVSVSDDAITLTREGMLHGDTSGKALARQLMEHY